MSHDDVYGWHLRHDEARFEAPPRKLNLAEAEARHKALESLPTLKDDEEVDWDARMERAKILLGICKLGTGKASWE